MTITKEQAMLLLRALDTCDQEGYMAPGSDKLKLETETMYKLERDFLLSIQLEWPDLLVGYASYFARQLRAEGKIT